MAMIEVASFIVESRWVSKGSPRVNSSAYSVLGEKKHELNGFLLSSWTHHEVLFYYEHRGRGSCPPARLMRIPQFGRASTGKGAPWTVDESRFISIIYAIYPAWRK